jgi:nicotinamide-nucleotide amidase
MGRASLPTASVVGVGDELLLGHTLNTNGSWLGQELSMLGFDVVRQEVVGDSRVEIQGALQRGSEVAEVLLITGGLGPTPDDLTRPAVAEHLNAPLEENAGLAEWLTERFRARGFEDLPNNNRAMALVPRGATIFPNPVGAAPGLMLETGSGGICILLPGIPAEMRGVFSENVRPFLVRRYGQKLRPVFHRVIFTTGIPESLLAQEMEHFLPRDMGPVSLAFLPDKGGVRIRFTARGVEGGEAEARFDALEERLDDFLRPYRFNADSGDLAEALGAALARAGAALATAESCTGGLISKRITDWPGSSRYFLGGVVAYSDEAKARLLGVPREALRKEGAVSREVAEEMAKGVAHRFGTSAGIGVTGVAGPGGGSAEKPVGTVWYAALLDGRVTSRMDRFLGSRDMVRERAAQAAMALLLNLLEGRAG